MISIKALLTRAIEQSHVFGTYHRHHAHATLELFQLSRIPRLYHATTSKIYGSLDHAKNEIRVIKIETGRWGDDISCRLKVVSLDRLLRPRYDTLSYTWGSSNNTKVIRVNGQTIDVSINLFTALRALRRRFQTVTIWADALCIDQENNSEKSKQVALMGRIYKQGRQTWVSFGCPDESWADGSWSPAPYLPKNARVLKRLFRGLWGLFWHHFFLRRSRQSRLGVNYTYDALRLMRVEDDLDELGQQNQRRATSMLTWLATHEYWTRVWVVQEIALSRKDPICIFGKHQVPLLSLDTILGDWVDGGLSLGTVFLDWLDRGFRFQESRRVGWSPEVGKGVGRAQEICMLRDEFLSMRTLRLTGSMELLRGLQFASYRRASIAHDYIYGLRSLLPANEQESLRPDYNLSVRELYASVTNLLLQKGNSASLLCAAVGTSQQNEHKLPSWSLDFSKHLRLPVHRSSPKNCEDSGDTSSGFDILRLQGKYLEELITAHVPRDYTFEGLIHYPELSNFLTRNIYEEDERKLDPYDTDTEVNWQQRHNSGFDERLAGPANDAEHASGSNSSLSQRYVVFLTHQGRFGKCPNEVQQDDEIWAFEGSKTAFVLRPLSKYEESPRLRNRYRLVGPCDFSSQVADTIDKSGRVTQSIEII